jgi:hypothetical protein
MTSMSDQEAEDVRHQLHQQYERPEQQTHESLQNDITAAIIGIRLRLDELASINADNIFASGEPPSRYHAIVEEAYAALGLIETQVDELRTELEYQHKRLDEIRDAALAQEQE